MDLIDQLRALGERIKKQLDQVATEEAAKTAFIMPFIQTLGYNVFDPTEVVPEYTADVGTKKGEKVDYAILLNGEPTILFECKWEGPELDEKHSGQLYRYFSVTKARIGVLTNGVIYRFYSDIEDKNKMDSCPFLVLDMRELNEHLVNELKRLTKENFDLDQMLSAAGELKYMREIKGVLKREMTEPSDEFIRHFFSLVAPGKRLTESNKQQFSVLISQALNEFVKENVDRRLKVALSAGEKDGGKDGGKDEAPPGEASTEDKPGARIETTEKELEGYFIVKTILREGIDASRITYRDRKAYFNVLLDDNNRKPICRLWLNSQRKYISLFTADKKENKLPIEDIDSIYEHADALRATVVAYDGTNKSEASSE